VKAKKSQGKEREEKIAVSFGRERSVVSFGKYW
jgi:hypothetical protein